MNSGSTQEKESRGDGWRGRKSAGEGSGWRGHLKDLEETAGTRGGRGKHPNVETSLLREFYVAKLRGYQRNSVPKL